MVIGEPVVTEHGTEITVEAPVAVERPGTACPPTLWFTFPARFAPFLTERADGFAAALLPLAMTLGERLTVDGDLSFRLAHGIRDYVDLQAVWQPGMFRAVEVRASGLRPAPPGESAGAVGTAFSGGVDSFHTLWTHLAANEPYPPARITHCLMINGFDPDADLANAGSFARLEGLYAQLMDRLGLEFVTARTNLLQFLGLVVLKQSFAAFVTAPALVLGRLFSRYYVPSSYRFTHLTRFTDGSHPALDHLLATESMETVHDGGHLTRVAKTVAISEWPETFDRLRVCVNRTGLQDGRDAIANCCTCEKCVRTMTTLEVAGALRRYRCFASPLTRGHVRRLDLGPLGVRAFAEENIEFARSAGRADIARDLRRAIRRSVLYRSHIRAVMLASYRLEQRSPRWAALVRRPKRLIQRSGLGGGWLYWVPR